MEKPFNNSFIFKILPNLGFHYFGEILLFFTEIGNEKVSFYESYIISNHLNRDFVNIFYTDLSNLNDLEEIITP